MKNGVYKFKIIISCLTLYVLLAHTASAQNALADSLDITTTLMDKKEQGTTTANFQKYVSVAMNVSAKDSIQGFTVSMKNSVSDPGTIYKGNYNFYYSGSDYLLNGMDYVTRVKGNKIVILIPFVEAMYNVKAVSVEVKKKNGEVLSPLVKNDIEFKK